MDLNSPFSIEDIGLTSDEVFNGLLDYGLFGEKLPPCFSTQGLSAINDPEIRATLDADTDKKLAKAIGSRSHDFITAIQWQFYDTPTKAATMAMGLL